MSDIEVGFIHHVLAPRGQSVYSQRNMIFIQPSKIKQPRKSFKHSLMDIPTVYAYN